MLVTFYDLIPSSNCLKEVFLTGHTDGLRIDPLARASV